MLTLAYYLLKVLLCSGIMYSYYLFALRNKRFHHYNRWYLLSIVALSLLIPLIKIEFWKEAPQYAVMEMVTIVHKADVYVAENSSSFNWDALAFGAYSSICFIFLLLLIVSLVKIFILIRKSPIKIWKNIYFVFSNAEETPFSFFKYIFWNNEIDIESNTGKQILNHELAHVYENHSADKLFLNSVLIVGWCNPFFWLIRKELNIIHEFIADRKAIDNGDAHSFALMLLNASYPVQTSILANSFFHSPIKRRLLMLTSSSNQRNSYLRRLMVLPLLAIVVLFFAFKSKNKDADIATNHLVETSLNDKQHWNQLQDQSILISADTANGSTKKIVGSITFENTPKSEFKDQSPWALVILNGERMSWKEFEAKNIAKTKFITAIFMSNNNNKLGAMFGDEAKNGLAIFTTKEIYEKTGTTIEDGQHLVFTKDANGKIKTYTKEEAIVRFGFRPSDIDHWFLEDRKLKDADPLPEISSNKTSTSVNGQEVVAQSDETAQFPGGLTEWKRYLERNLNLNVLKEQKAPIGKYPVVVSFTISKDGSIKNVITETKTEYGTGEEVIRTIEKGRKWQPAKKDGVSVESKVKHTITFTVVKEGWSYVEINSTASKG